MKILNIIKEAKVRFSFYRNGMLYYEVIKGDKPTHIFPVNIEDKNDIGSATFPAECKAITLMRYIRKSIENESIAEIR